MQKMRRSMMPLDRPPPCLINRHLNFLTDCWGGVITDKMQPNASIFCSLINVPNLRAHFYETEITNLSAKLSIGGCGIQNNGGFIRDRNDFQHFGLSL